MITRVVNLWQRWGFKVGCSIADQGIVSGANFTLNVMLARWLSPADYGAFAVSFSIFHFLSGFHNALILEPMAVLGSGWHPDQKPHYLGSLIWLHIGLTGILGVLLALIALVLALAGSAVAASLLGVACATPFILLFWLLRRVCYLETKPDLALKGSIFYVAFLFLGLVCLWHASWVSPFTGFLVMGLASAGVGLVFWRLLRVQAPFSLIRGESGVNAVLSRHWLYGRWVVASTFVYGLGGTIYVPLIGAFAGLDQAGAFRAMQNLLLPLSQTLVALDSLLVPWVSGQRKVRGDTYVKWAWPQFTMANGLFACTYVVILIMFGKWLVGLLYGEGYYAQFLWLLPYAGATAVIGALGNGMNIGFKALEHSDVIFWSQAGAALSTVTVGFYLLWQWGLHGAAVGAVCSSLLGTIIVSSCLWKRLKWIQ